MKIGIDIRKLFDIRTGVEKNFWELLENLGKIDKKNEYVFFLNKSDILPTNFCFSGKYKILRFEYSKMLSIKTQLKFRQKIKEEGIDVFFSTIMAYPFIAKCKKITTIHDLCWRYIVRDFSIITWLLQELWFRLNLYFSDFIITPSESVKNTIINQYPKLRNKIDNVGSYITNFENINIQKNECPTGLLKNKYFLAIGTHFYRKNYLILIKAYKIFLEKKKMSNDFKLLKIGKYSKSTNSIIDFIGEYGLEKFIVLANYVSDEELYKFYKNCFCYINVSLVEGYGIPIIEAMQFGCPIICSDIEVFREITNNGVLFVNHHNENAIAEAMERLYEDKELYNQQRKISERLFEEYKTKNNPAKKILEIITNQLK